MATTRRAAKKTATKQSATRNSTKHKRAAKRTGTKKPAPKKPRQSATNKAVTKAKPANGSRSPAPMGDDRWWSFIERARKGAEDPDEMVERLIEVLGKELSADEIIAFDTFVNERIRDAFRWDLWAVAYIMNGGCSDDGFDYFCGWLVGKGKAHYLAALANPEDAAKGVSPDDEPFENEGMWYAASRAWEAKTGKTTDDFYAVAPRVTRQLQGEPFDEETVDTRHPKLARRFGGG